MILFGDILILCLALLVAVPMLIFSLECAAALLSSCERHESPNAPQPQLAILIPAHNEEQSIVETVKAISAQLKNEDRIVVVADNCTDRTADLARQADVIVIERQETALRGKGYALDFGVRYLESAPPEVLIIVDADCSVQAGSLAALADAARKTDRPAQAIYMMEPPHNAQPRDFISAFAFLVKNHVRPLGCNFLGWPCFLTGTGMAFPWKLIRDASLANGNIVEDMQLGLTLALSGAAPRLCTGARITSRLPAMNDAAASQRKRWEHGHLQTLLEWGPKLLIGGCLQRRAELLALAIQLCVPPLALLVLTWITAISLALLAKFLPGISWLPVIVLSCAGGLMILMVSVVWHRFSRSLVPARSLLSIPLYVTWKIPLYVAFLFRRQKAWVRTAR